MARIEHVSPPPQTDAATAEDVRLRVEALERLTEQLQQALTSRIVIEQAKGVLSERHRIPPNEAFEMLRRSARSRQRNIHAVAEEIVASAHRKPATPDA